MRHAVVKGFIPILIKLMTIGKIDDIEVIQGLPKDCRFVSAGHDYYGNLYLIVEHESFEDLADGAEYPEIEILHRKLS